MSRCECFEFQTLSKHITDITHFSVFIADLYDVSTWCKHHARTCCEVYFGVWSLVSIRPFIIWHYDLSVIYSNISINIFVVYVFNIVIVIVSPNLYQSYHILWYSECNRPLITHDQLVYWFEGKDMYVYNYLMMLTTWRSRLNTRVGSYSSCLS